MTGSRTNPALPQRICAITAWRRPTTTISPLTFRHPPTACAGPAQRQDRSSSLRCGRFVLIPALTRCCPPGGRKPAKPLVNNPIDHTVRSGMTVLRSASAQADLRPVRRARPARPRGQGSPPPTQEVREGHRHRGVLRPQIPPGSHHRYARLGNRPSLRRPARLATHRSPPIVSSFCEYAIPTHTGRENAPIRLRRVAGGFGATA